MIQSSSELRIIYMERRTCLFLLGDLILGFINFFKERRKPKIDIIVIKDDN